MFPFVKGTDINLDTVTEFLKFRTLSSLKCHFSRKFWKDSSELGRKLNVKKEKKRKNFVLDLY